MTDQAVRRRKSRNAAGNASGMKKLRQKTLLGSVTSEAGSPPTRLRASITTSGKPHSPRKTKKRHASDSSELPDIRLEPVTPAKPEERDRSQSPVPSRIKRRRMLVVKSDSNGEDTQSSSSKVVSAPRRRKLRGHALAVPESSEESFDQRHSVDKAKNQERVSEDDLSDEVDKHCTSPIALLEWYSHIPDQGIIKSRLRTRNKKTVFQRNLERLKRKKAVLIHTRFS